MRYVAAYLLAALGGNDKPAAKDIKKILESVGIEADETRMDKVQSSLLFIVFLVLRQQLFHQRLVIVFVMFTNLISQQVITELSGKNVDEVIATGYGKLASVPAGGAVAVASSAAAGSGGAAAPAAEEKKEEKKEESEESDDDMGFGLFD
ncbi:large ribosomal subunit protein P2-like isoform X1 [Enoplosus armatus]|uniref:large ribosomal subunit protein P2-like isoform X1 n=1 Tax=Enoplosus armatus TaxID=215367 RepID=UPI0039913ECE